jgi:hypothetical protein
MSLGNPRKKLQNATSEVITEVLLRIQVFWNVNLSLNVWFVTCRRHAVPSSSTVQQSILLGLLYSEDGSTTSASDLIKPEFSNRTTSTQYFVPSLYGRWNLFYFVITTERRPHFTQRKGSWQCVALVSHNTYLKDDIHIWYGIDSLLS